MFRTVGLIVKGKKKKRRPDPYVSDNDSDDDEIEEESIFETPAIAAPQEAFDGITTKTRHIDLNGVPPAPEGGRIDHTKAKPRNLFSTLPQEIRDQIYNYVLPLPGKCVHVRQQKVTGPLSNVICKQSEWGEHQSVRDWMSGRSDKFKRARHEGCGQRAPRLTWRKLSWTFALLFTCRQIYQDICDDIYRNYSFAFETTRARIAFVKTVPAKRLGLIQDLRQDMNIGAWGDTLFHYDPATANAICQSFTGLRKLLVTISLAFYSPQQVREALKRHWKMMHWARCVLNFAGLPLEELIIGVNHFNDYPLRAYYATGRGLARLNTLFPAEYELKQWAHMITERILVPTERPGTKKAMHDYQLHEAAYHRKACSTIGGQAKLPGHLRKAIANPDA